MNSEIIITQDYDSYIKDLYENNRICKVYQGDEFLLENARDIMQNAYLMEEHDKIFVLAYKDYSVQAQNYMLKLLEEPPVGVYFKILVYSKNILLPTIKSRLISKKLYSNKIDLILNLNLHTITLIEISELKLDYSPSDFVVLLFKECIKQNIRLSTTLLDEFYKCYELGKLNLNIKVIAIRLLLGIIRERS
ncbi:DNA polymerase III subunit delta' [Campylobacter sp. MG1]|uniref:DNA polymerase III subunit delta' n=1 Tax=Campylobacter sp. MG1 TaxID=2976332 RepID=UPI00226C9F3C|nr:DNA polymerase III subunit delta' [Campylobacter sp. MG1]